MSGSSGTFKPVKDRRKKSPVRRVTVSDETKRAYEDFAKAREDRERTYGQFLPDESKGKR